MNILITGANGLLGVNLVNILSNEHIVYAVVKNKRKINFHVNSNVKIIEIDLLDFNEDRLPSDIDAIYYLAQSNKFRDFPDSYDDIFSINISTVLKFSDWARNNKVKKFFYASSGGVYKNPKQPVSEFFDINANVKNGFYLDSKLSAEILLKNYVDFFDTFIIFRPFFMYGENQNKDMLIPRLINNIINHKTIILNGENGIKINPIYIEDAATAFASALSIDNGEYIFNIAGNEVVSLKEICEKIADIVNEKVLYDIKEANQNDLVADTKLMKERLSIPKISIEKALKRVIKEYK